MVILLVLMLQMKVPDAANFVGQPQGPALVGEQLTKRTAEVSALVRCPVCQGMSVADSPAEMAVNMKAQVNELLARGYTEEQILKYFELSYGQFVLLRPKFEGANRAVWILPIVALVIGGAVLAFKLRRLKTENHPAMASAAPARTIPDVVADPYLARVRELVGGDQS